MSLLKEKKKVIEPRKVSKSLFELKVKGTLCDVHLRLQGSTMSAHACVLASSSSYFFELFQLNQEIHWCAKNPLVIDLENVMSSATDLCVTCVSKIIDFMYLRELVILQDHYEHFVAINSLFHIFPMPLGKKFKNTNLCKPVKVDSSISNQLSEKSKKVQLNESGTADDSPSQQTPQTWSSDDQVPVDCSVTKILNCAISEGVKCEGGEHGESKSKPNVVTNCKVNSNPEKIIFPIQDSTSSPGTCEQLNKVKKETKIKKYCEFMCCNSEPDVSSCRAKVRKRRIMNCEQCDFSSVSLRKILQHLKSTDHFETTCPICLRNIHDMNDFKEHLKDHANSKPFICHICNKRNRYWDYHKMHLKIHCRNKPFYCDLCQRGFVSKRNLTEHLVTHKGSYLCKKCNYYSSDLNNYRSHLLQHGKEDSIIDSGSDFHLDATDAESKNQKVQRFQCQICGEKFTLKKNLARHVKLIHFDVTKLKCAMCPFETNRTDLMSTHMKKQHNCTLVKKKKKSPSQKNLEKGNQKSSDFVSVLVPIQLVSESPSGNGFATKDCGRGLTNPANGGKPTCTNDHKSSNSNSHVIIQQNPSIEALLIKRQITLNPSEELKNQSGSFSVGFLQDTCREPDRLRTDSNMTDPLKTSSSENMDRNIQFSFMTDSNIDSDNNFANRQTLNDTDLSKGRDINTINRQENITDILEKNKYIWLNETTGELLSDETIGNMQSQKSSCRANQNVSETGNSTLDFCDQFKNAILGEGSGEFSNFDLRDDNEEYPQTPQASVVGIDDCDNLFPWNQIDNSFYSTWVLNETTGELNMASFFSIQSVKNPTELKLSENSESFTSFEDDDTALFLNEGTGDLSVIYFNPNGPERSDLKIHSGEKSSHDNLETLSENSDDDTDMLNEEFMRVSASFMSNEENEKFLNELTGEFDIASLNNYQPELFSNQVAGEESYLNEETGEISWNIMDNNVNNDLFAKPDSLEYDMDDSLNCEDFESFFRDVSGFSSQFCLDDASENWQSTDEASDALVLNECTGELIKRT